VLLAALLTLLTVVEGLESIVVALAIVVRFIANRRMGPAVVTLVVVVLAAIRLDNVIVLDMSVILDEFGSCSGSGSCTAT